MILFYVLKNTCNSLVDNYLCIFSCTVQMPLILNNIWVLEKYLKAKFKSKQHQNPSLEKPSVLKIGPKFSSHLVQKQLNSPCPEWGFKKEQAEKQKGNCNMCK